MSRTRPTASNQLTLDLDTVIRTLEMPSGNGDMGSVTAKESLDMLFSGVSDRLYGEVNLSRRHDLFFISGLNFPLWAQTTDPSVPPELPPRNGSGRIVLASREHGFRLTPRHRDVLAAMITLYILQGNHTTKMETSVPIETTLYELAMITGVINSRRDWGSYVAAKMSRYVLDLWSAGVQIWEIWVGGNGGNNKKEDNSEENNTSEENGRRGRGKPNHQGRTASTATVTMDAFHFVERYSMRLHLLRRDAHGRTKTVHVGSTEGRGKIWLGVPIQDNIRRGLLVPLSRRVLSLLSRGPETVPAKNLYYYLAANEPMRRLQDGDGNGNGSKVYEITFARAREIMGIVEDAKNRNGHRAAKRIVRAAEMLDQALRQAGEGRCLVEVRPAAASRQHKLVLTLQDSRG